MALATLLLAVSSAAVLEPVEATQPATVQSLLASEDACQGAGSDTQQCSVSLRQLRGEQQRQLATGLDPKDMPVKVSSNSSGSGSSGGRHMSMSSGMAPGSPTGTLTGKERTGAGTDYKPDNPDLLTPSPAPLLEFYMYRVISDEVYPLVNANAANLAGVLWYLHHEVVVQYPRKFNISKIVRLKVRMRPTKPLYEKGMNFGVRGAFDKGQATGPFVCGHEPVKHAKEGGIQARPRFCGGKEAQEQGVTGVNGEPLDGPYEWSQFGYFVGCNLLGQWPFPTYAVHYPGAVWYSLPGACPSKQFHQRNEGCNREEPGGYCPGEPTGTGDCTWNYNVSGEISINELVGISEREWPKFKRHGKKEYDPFRDQGRKFGWWNNINSREANMRRLREAQRLFRERYPHQTPDENMPHPPCDFDRRTFYEEYYTRNPDLVPCRDAWQVPECREAIQRAREDIKTHPSQYPDLSVGSPDQDFQTLLWKNDTDSACPKPCK